MIQVTLKGLAGRKLRAALTALAVLVGVAMVSATFVFTDSIDKALDTLFTDAYTGSDAVISGRDVVRSSASGDATVPGGVLATVEALPEVAAAAGGVVDTARLIDKHGDPISDHTGALGLGIDTSQARFNPLRLRKGRWPTGPSEVAIDTGTAEKEGFAPGETIGLAAEGRVRPFTISGVAEFTSVESLGALTLAIFDIPTAQSFFDKQGRFDEIYVAAKDGISSPDLLRGIEPILPSTAEVATGEAQSKAEAAGTDKEVAFLQKVLLAFGGLAVFVGGFVVLNTLSTTVAHRTRELATLRTLGATRRQVLGSVMLESFVIGVLASAAGLLVGIALAKGLTALFVAAGQELPHAGTVVSPRTVLVSFLVGVVITVVAGLLPALRATAVPPITAVREGPLPRSPLARYVPYIAAGSSALGVGLLAAGRFVTGLSVTGVLLLLAIGCLALFIGVAMVSSRLVKPLAAILGWPARRLGGAAGQLAQENSLRNPDRTAVTAAALMIGLAAVTFVAVVGQGLQTSVGHAVEQAISADYVVTADDGVGPLTPDAAAALAGEPGVQAVSSVRQDTASIDGSDQSVSGIDPRTIADVMTFDWNEGSDATFATLGTGGAVLQRHFAEDHGLGVGSTFSVLTAQGRKIDLTVRGTYTPPKLDPILGPILISSSAFDASFERTRDVLALVDTTGGISTEQTNALQQALSPFPEATLHTRADFATGRQKEIRTTLNVLYALLALSIVVSLIGMINTVVLSVHERTSEVGMLRAIGMTPRQLRRMLRHESVITALIGAALGLPLGLFLAALVTRALSKEGVAFAVPIGTLGLFAMVAVLAGVCAAMLPARRASRLNVLEALQYE
jgi:putative ABC transport system permease protein